MHKCLFLIISGEEDKVIDKQQSLDMHILAKNSTLLIIKDAGHLSNLEQPDKWNDAVISKFKLITNQGAYVSARLDKKELI